MCLWVGYGGVYKFTAIAWPTEALPQLPPALSPSAGPQDFMLIRTLGDASDEIRSVAWSGHLLAAAGGDRQVRLYNVCEDSGSLASGVR